jgi:diaminohydroxyphosphoribosylaminopyrimidine deaminase / 5-amino-6-(5-phosphoribosylamino)uracil reductase
MINHEQYMRRCLELAKMRIGHTYPNPMVGAVIVYNEKIIGEGCHELYGGAHAEVNAINSVTDSQLLKHSTLYVNLEPCSHFGKTPPCADLIIGKQIPHVVVGTIDPSEKVSGNGIARLKESGCDVIYPVLEKECRDLNHRFFHYHINKRPYIILKWAQTKDGFIDKDRQNLKSPQINWITSENSRKLVHKWRSEEHSIMVGTNTVIADNPQLTVREWTGKNPIRITVDYNHRLSGSLNIFNEKSKTIVFKKRINKELERNNIEQIIIPEHAVSENLTIILNELHSREIQSVLVEGGSKLIQSFLNAGYWDEARVFVGNIIFNKGVAAPVIPHEFLNQEIQINDDDVLKYYVKNTSV